MSVVNSDSVRAGAAGAGGGSGSGLVLEQSVRNDGTARTQRTVSGRAGRKMTWDLWIKRCAPGARDYLWRVAPYGSVYLAFDAADTFTFYAESDAVANTWISRTTTAVYRDVNAWYHITVGVDANQTDNTCCKIEINGVEITDFGTTNNPPSADRDLEGLNDPTAWMSEVGATTDALNGYAARLIYIDGYKLDASSFSEFDANGIDVPIDVSGLTWSGEACHLDFADSSDYGNDVSGLNNDYTDTNFAATDSMRDSPTDDVDNGLANYPTLSPLYRGADSDVAPALTDGNLTISLAGATSGTRGSTMPIPTTGKWYFEITINAAGSDHRKFGIITTDSGCLFDAIEHPPGYEASDFALNMANGYKLNNDTGASYGAAASGGIVQMAVDMDNGKIWWGDDNTWYASGNPATGANAAYTSLAEVEYYVVVSLNGSANITVNFGQLSGGFTYTPPTSFKALCTANLPAPAIVDSSANFQTTLYTGNGTAIGSGGKVVNQSGNSTFQPDFVWIKNRDATDSHMLFDALRGVTKSLNSNAITTEATDTESLSTFDADGFTVGSNVKVNTSSEDYVAWQWLANGSGASNTEGSIHTTSTSANTTAGFSIITYTGTGSNATIGHGLTSAPEFILFKNRTGVEHLAWHKNLTTDDESFLVTHTTAAEVTKTLPMNSTTPSATLISLGAAGSYAARSNESSVEHVAWVWHSVEGYSKFGSYEGNNAVTDGTFVHCGFTPELVIIKNIDTAIQWIMIDGQRSPYNQNTVNNTLFPNDAKVESSANDFRTDILSNGFKIKNNNVEHGSAHTFVYAAWAKSPFGGDGVNQARAR